MRWSAVANIRSIVVLAALGAAIVGVVGRSRVAARPPADATYIGQKNCRICHFREFISWKKSRHAQAWQTLPEKDRKRPECFPCHVTGHGEESGYESEEATPHLTGVQCESCHGPGSVHAEVAKVEESEEAIDGLIDRIPANTCVKCHNPHKDPCEGESETGMHAASKPASPAGMHAAPESEADSAE